MSTNGSSTPEDFEKRVTGLEKQLRFLKRVTAGLALLVCLMGFAGWKSYKAGVRGVVEARCIELKDANGHMRAKLTMRPGGPALEFYDANGKVTWVAPEEMKLLPLEL